MSSEKENFCKGNYYVLQEVKNKLYALMTEVMMNKAKYVKEQAIEGSKGQITKLRKVKNQVDKRTSIADTKKVNKDKLIKELDVAKKALTEVLQEELPLTPASTRVARIWETRESHIQCWSPLGEVLLNGECQINLK